MATIKDIRLEGFRRRLLGIPDEPRRLFYTIGAFLLLVGNAKHTPAPPYSMRIDWDPDDLIYVVSVPELPGCMTHGATYEEGARKGSEAIASWLDAAKKFGDPLPDPRVVRHLLDEDAPEQGERVSA